MRAIGVLLLVAACGGAPKQPTVATVKRPATRADKILALLPVGAQVVVELDLARLRANAVVGPVITRALAARKADLPAGVPASPLATAELLTLAAYGVGTAQAATVTILASPVPVPDATKLADDLYAIGPADWVAQVADRAALAGAADARLPIAAPADLLNLRDHAMPDGAPGASLRITARLPFDARVALARQTGLDAAPAQLSVWGDVVDDLAIIVDADASDPGEKSAKGAKASVKRLENTLRAALGVAAGDPTLRALGLPASLAGARLVERAPWVRTIVAVGPAHLQRVVARAQSLLTLALAPEKP